MKRRFYLHGDHGLGGLYYCAVCDLFMPADHFLYVNADKRHRPPTHRLRLERSQKTLSKLQAKGLDFFRPAKARNLVASLPPAGPRK